MELAREELLAAKSKYESAFNIAHNLGPTQVLTGSIHYKMGVVEVELGNFETASSVLPFPAVFYCHEANSFLVTQKSLLSSPHDCEVSQNERSYCANDKTASAPAREKGQLIGARAK